MWKVLFFLFVLLVICFNQPLKEYLFVEDYEEVDYGKNSNSKNEHTELKNIYGEKLKQCRHKHQSGNRGSWSNDGFCDEMDGGVHQICVEVDKTDNIISHT